MKDLTNGLKYIHNEGYLHRGLKPSDILIGDENELVISDFSLAIEKEKSENGIAGTPIYNSPETLSGKAGHTESSDIYSLGCIFYEIYTLRKRINKARNFNELKKEIDADLDFNRIKDEREEYIEELIIRMIDKDPTRRMKLSEIEERINQISSYISSNKQESIPPLPVLPPPAADYQPKIPPAENGNEVKKVYITDGILRVINNHGVYLVKHNDKTLIRKDSRCQTQFIENEIEVLKKLKHRNIVRMVDYSIEKRKKMLYMKYYEKGDLDNLIEEKKKKGEDFSIDV